MKPQRPLRVCVIEHHEKPRYKSLIQLWGNRRGHDVHVVHATPEKTPQLPNVDDFDMVVVMGGTTHAHESHVQREIDFLSEAVRKGKKVLGVCLGAQLLALSQGGELLKKRDPVREWGELRLTRHGRKSRIFPSDVPRVTGLLSHAYAFKRTPGKVTLHYDSPGNPQASGPMAFELHGGRVVGILAHFEQTRRRFREIQPVADELFARGELTPVQYDRMMAGTPHIPRAAAYFLKILDNLAAHPGA